MPTLVITGSASTQAMSPSRSAARERLFVVEFDDRGRGGEDRELARSRLARITEGAVSQVDEGVVDRAMIGAVEGQNLAVAR
jgi:hypothetical protein